ncbi:MAG: glycosyl hydrolase 115 family protein [Kiritimatiellia bacterium]
MTRKRQLLAPALTGICGPLLAVTVEVAPGESEAVRVAAANLRQDIARVCPDHERDARKIIIKTSGQGGWESSVRTYANGTWTIAGADRRGTVYGIYAVSEEIGISPFYWWDDIPVAQSKTFALSTKTRRIDSPVVKYRGIFINDEDWCLRPWAVENLEKNDSRSIGLKTYEKVFEMMLRARLNVIWPAMHGGGYEFASWPENFELADKMGVVVGTSHCEPMLRNNVYWDKRKQGEWNYATNRDEINRYWQDAVDRYGKYEILWTIGIRGTHDAPMSGGNSMADKVKLVEEVFKTQLGMLDKGVKPLRPEPPAMNFIPYKEVLPIYDAGLKVPKASSIMWVDDNFGYIRRLGGPSAAGHKGGIYWHVSYFGGPHSYTHVNTTAPGFIWYELGAKCIDNDVKETWILNVGDVKPADIAIDAFARIAWSPQEGGPDFQDQFLRRWTAAFLGRSQQALVPRVVRHMREYYALGMIRKPELMAQQWIAKLTEAEKRALDARYAALAAEDAAIEAALKPEWRDGWYSAFGYQARFLAASGRYFMSADALEASGQERVQREIRALTTRHDTIFDGKWKHFWYDTFPARGWDNTENGWASQMQWPWKEPQKGRWYEATAGGDGILAEAWTDAAEADKVTDAAGGGWRMVAGLGVSGRAMALLPVKVGAGAGAALAYDLDWKGGDSARAELVLQFLPDYRLYPGLRLRVAVEVNGGARRIVEVPYSDGTKDENSRGRCMAVQDNFVRTRVACPEARQGVNHVRVIALDPGVVLDRLALTGSR